MGKSDQFTSLRNGRQVGFSPQTIHFSGRYESSQSRCVVVTSRWPVKAEQKIIVSSQPDPVRQKHHRARAAAAFDYSVPESCFCASFRRSRPCAAGLRRQKYRLGLQSERMQNHLDAGRNIRSSGAVTRLPPVAQCFSKSPLLRVDNTISTFRLDRDRCKTFSRTCGSQALRRKCAQRRQLLTKCISVCL